MVVWGGEASIGLFWWRCEVLLLNLLCFTSLSLSLSLSLNITTIDANGSWIGDQIALRLVRCLICGGRSEIRLCFSPFGLHLGWCYRCYDGKLVVDMWVGRSVTVVACGLRLWFMVDCGFDFVMVNWWLICNWQIVWVVVRTKSMGAWWRWCCIERKREIERENKEKKNHLHMNSNRAYSSYFAYLHIFTSTIVGVFWVKMCKIEHFLYFANF